MAELKDRYAQALFELALDSGNLPQFLEQADHVRDVLTHEQSFLLHPQISAAAKKELINALFEGKISPDIMGFLTLSIDKNREHLILPVLNEFLDMANRAQGKTVAIVVSATPLSQGQIENLQRVLSKKTGKQVEILPKTDASILGGMYIHMGDLLIDRTIKTQLQKLSESLKSEGN